MIATTVGLIFFSYPIFSLLLTKEMPSIIMGHILLMALISISAGPIMALLVEAFPTRVRYSGMALSYNISAAGFGGTAPMVAQWLMNETGDAHSIAYYVMACAVVSLIALFFYQDRYKEPLR